MFFYLSILLIVITIPYLLAIMPKIRNTVDFTGFKGRFYAHRGLHDNKNISPENSIKAFQLAIDNDYGIEFDVQLSKDNIPVVFHDYNLKRVCGVDGYIWDYNYEELKNFSLFNSNEKIPLLQEVLDLVNGRVPLIVELKGESKDPIISSIVATYLDNYNGVYCVESFNPMIVHWYKKNRPHIIRGQLSMKYGYKNKSMAKRILNFALEKLLFNFMTKPDFIAYRHKDCHMLSLTLCRKLYSVFTVTYTIQSQEELEKCWHVFDLFIFDNFIPEKVPK